MSLAAVILFLLFPVLLVLLVVVRLCMGKPVFFRQKRPGLMERPFTLVKLRTMNAQPYRIEAASPDAARITPVGAFLRKTSLDELPELVSVLRGDMSLVGPRPLLMEYLPYYTSEERKRFLVRPGLTGLAQISGRNTLGWDARLALDAEFVDRLSPWLYLTILLKTPLMVLTAEGVAVDAYSVSQPLHVERRDSVSVKITSA